MHLIRDRRFRFVVALACWSVALLAVLRSRLGQRALVAPFTAWHAAFASDVAGGSPVTVDLSCSGSDVIALSIAAILAYPVSWRRRLSGVAIASVWLGGLNLLRVMTLVYTVGTSLFTPLHLYIWPGMMIAGSMAFVVAWVFIGSERHPMTASGDSIRPRPFIVVAGVLLIGYVAAAPRLLASDSLALAAMNIASAAAMTLNTVGVDAVVGGGTLVVAQQAFLVTPECILTPLMPVYLAWAITWPSRRRARLAAALAFVPMFAVLACVRLLTVALPGIIGPPLFLTHGFYQFLVAFLMLALAARWHAQTMARPALRYLAYAVVAAVLVAAAFGQAYTWLVESAARTLWSGPTQTWSGLRRATDVQGATAIMPVFQLSLLCGLCIALRGRRAITWLALLIPIAAGAQTLTLLIVWELGSRVGAEVPVTAIRVGSLLTPAVLVSAAALNHRVRPALAVVRGSPA